MRLRFLFGIILIIIASTNSVSAQSIIIEDNYKGIDSSLYAYLRVVENNQNYKVSVLMADTLYHMAKKYNSEKMQIIALCKKMLYYYSIARNEDTVKYYADIIIKKSEKANLTEYIYYAWQIKINLNMILGKWVNAIVESKKMQQCAMAHNNNLGMIFAWNGIGMVLTNFNLHEEALKYYMKIVNVSRGSKFRNYNEYNTYLNVGCCFNRIKQYDSALKYLKIAETKVKKTVQQQKVFLRFAEVYTEIGDFEKAEQYFDLINLISHKIVLSNADKTKWYNAYAKFLIQYSDKVGNKNKLRDFIINPENVRFVTSFVLGDAYKSLGNYKEAIQFYKKALAKQNKHKRVNMLVLMDMMGYMNLSQLDYSKKKLDFEIDKIETIIILITIILALILIAVYGIWYCKSKKLNKKLSTATSEFAIKNEFLEQAFVELAEQNKQLAQAKDELYYNNKALSEAKNELVTALIKADEVSKEKTNFIKNISHEFRTPMNAIVGFSQIMAEVFGEEKKEIVSYTRPILFSVNNLLRMITDIVDLSMFETDNYQSYLVDFEVNELVEQCVNQYRKYFETGVQVVVNSLNESIYMHGDRYAFENVIFHTLNNASKFTYKGFVKILCRYSITDKIVTIVVQDSGTGINPEVSDKIFEKYFKIDDYTSGLGIGLNLAKLFAKVLGGDYYLDKDYTAGARFVFECKVN